MNGGSDSFSVKVVVITLAILTLGGAAAISYLSFTGTTIPDQLDRLTAGAVGALVGILASTRTGTTPVTVENRPGDPVPVEETADPPTRPLRRG